MASADLIEELSCSICLSIYTDPVTLRCGHNYCRECIDHVLDTQKAAGLYICPECREEFKERPSLFSARALRNIAEKFLISQPVPEDTGIYCTECVDSPVPAIKSCLLCETSLCAKHLRDHAKSPEHVFTDPIIYPGNRKCSFHKKAVEYYCPKERVCFCVYCMAVGLHKGHPVEKLDKASEKKKEKLRKDLEILTSKKAWAEKEVRSLKKRKTDLEDKADDIMETVTAMFQDIGKDLEELEKRVLSEISKEKEMISESVSNLIQQLEKQKDELSRKMSQIEELCKTADPILVLKDQNSNEEEDIYQTKEEDNIDTKIPSEDDFHEHSITAKLHELSDFIKDFQIGTLQSGILLDEETASNYIQVSKDLRTASLSAVKLFRPESPRRFKNYQVLSKRVFSSGQHSWEVDTSNSNSWRVGLCYPTMDKRSYIGDNKSSWCLQKEYKYNIMHVSKCIPFIPKPTSYKFQICLDYEAGQISFYELNDPIRHLHTFNTTFTKPLHLVICIWNGSMTITN
ncbi:E3 ubiquitin/ISG15 ligase TRIM25-like [Rana temporaria]|uniref:E3 ubiquitin/ISG15 ligase TRIM25-like n=1 Tax=Rana temporaria TaxID=8407 RepID=UPI001AADFC41|nr:E3 ubiquitin/ISG15 ligase TRIM25-like [Rana temporaria]